MDILCPQLGILLSLTGTFLVACSFGENLEGAYQTTKKGRKVYLASFLHPWWFRVGMVIIFIGSMLSVIL